MYLVSGIDWDNPYFRAILYRNLRQYKTERNPIEEITGGKSPYKDLNSVIKAVKSSKSLSYISKSDRDTLHNAIDILMDELPEEITNYHKFENKKVLKASKKTGIRDYTKIVSPAPAGYKPTLTSKYVKSLEKYVGDNRKALGI